MKTIIMAGGEGSRLRPLTCDIPKPMARLCGKPVIDRILEWAAHHGVTDSMITLRYLPDVLLSHFENAGGNIRFSLEETPLGTAGGVKQAARDFCEEEDILVLSGDALCDFDLSAAMRFHKEQQADVTLLVTRVGDPREYGLVTTDGDGRVSGFVEKPSWSGVTTDAANTGIYLLSPSVLPYIPDGRSFDFAQNLFPLLMQKGKKIMACEQQGYWCDIGDLQSYLRCQWDILNDRTGIVLPKTGREGVYCTETLPQGNYKIFPPVYIGSRVTIGEGAVIGPDTVLDDGVTVGAGARVRGSVLLPDSYVGERARLTGAILCSGSTVKQDAALFEGVTVGAGAGVGERAECKPGVAVWPGKQVEPGAVLTDHLRYGVARTEYFDDDGISGEAGADMTPEFCARIGAALGSLCCGGRIGTGRGEGTAAKALYAALTSGALSTGAQVWDFGAVNEAQMAFSAGFCGLSVSAYLSGGSRCAIHLMGESGLPVSRMTERELQNHLQKGQFIRCGWSSYRDKADMHGVLSLYRQELYRCAPKGLAGVCARVRCPSAENEHMLEDVLNRLGCDTAHGPILHLSRNGTALSAAMESEVLSEERVLALCCETAFEAGEDVALPHSAPQAISSLATRHERKAVRYSSDTDLKGEEERRLVRASFWLRDGMMMAVRLLSALHRHNISLEEYNARLPAFSVVVREIPLADVPSGIMRSLSEEGTPVGDGVLFIRKTGNILLCPGKRGRTLKLHAESENSEIAAALCDGLEQQIKQLDKGAKR